MKKIETGCRTIFRYDNVLDPETCAKIYQHVMNSQNNKSSSVWINENNTFNWKYLLSFAWLNKNNTLPWFENNTFRWLDIKDNELKNKIIEYRKKLTYLVRTSYQKNYHVQFTDIVLWNENKCMGLHKDDGYDDDVYELKRRKVTTVTYINDNYEGGETYIANETGNFYINEPKIGSVVILLSDATNMHGVNKILRGKRVTLPIWFCESEEHSEDYKIKNDRR